MRRKDNGVDIDPKDQSMIDKSNGLEPMDTGATQEQEEDKKSSDLIDEDDDLDFLDDLDDADSDGDDEVNDDEESLLFSKYASVLGALQQYTRPEQLTCSISCNHENGVGSDAAQADAKDNGSKAKESGEDRKSASSSGGFVCPMCDSKQDAIKQV